MPALSPLRLWGPVAAWMAVIFAVSSRPVPDGVARIPDWLTHGGAYAVLAVLICRALAGGLAATVPVKIALAAVLASTLYGITDEVHQSFVPGRMPDVADVVKDFLGASVGAAGCALPRASAGAHRRKAA